MNTPHASSHEEKIDIEALRQGDLKAFNALIRQEGPRVYRCIYRLIQDEEEARNLTQETFIQAFQHINSFRGDAKISTWLCAIGINLARSALRKMRYHETLDEATIDQLQPSFVDGHYAEQPTEWQPERFVENKELGELIQKALNKLPPQYKTIIILRDMEGLSTEDTAELLGMSAGAVRVRLHRARQALRKILDEYLKEH